MTRQTVLITGASGFIGTALIARLRNKYYIVGLDKKLYNNRDSNVLWYKVDISDKRCLGEFFNEIKAKISGKIDYVFHLAAYYDMSNKENRRYHETNENGTRYLLDNLIHFNVKNFIFTSSTVVFKPVIGNEKLNEGSNLSTFMHYGNSKISGEKIVSEYREKIQSTIFRLSGVYSQDCRSIPLANQIVFIWNRSFGYRILPGRGDGGISYVHIEDVLDAFEKSMLMAQEIPSGSIMILSEEYLLSNNELCDLISREIYGKHLNLIHLPIWIVWFCIIIVSNFYLLTGKRYFFKPWMLKLTDKKYQFNIEKAKQTLNWQPRFQMKTYMAKIINNLKGNPDRWNTINKIK
ncbi:NAD-dependent epimerase/dehydratase [Candidatus Scalindua japonica]|uniref:NAD-dependent epimerase/dehydratase n=1 Tax=Candidatus Scalindua japonica TaxID=1284222 RepID=A0A286U0M6_9BACT|nr:NAD(P)-dependent oxidoreductase [Candidatus Scalindua japonica]GAX61699.1 NAD-dependent epimerase/dehydratase [Candidatus Scalindua japonica]